MAGWPYAIALYTGKGIPMLWQGQEFGENWSVPKGGIGRNLFQRPLHWEYFYDRRGKTLVRLYRILGELRRRHRALRSRDHFFYYNDPDHLGKCVIAFRREAPATATEAAESMVILLNFSDQTVEVSVEFPAAGHWVEQIDIRDNPRPPVDASHDGARTAVVVASNYGAVFLKQ